MAQKCARELSDLEQNQDERKVVLLGSFEEGFGRSGKLLCEVNYLHQPQDSAASDICPWVIALEANLLPVTAGRPRGRSAFEKSVNRGHDLRMNSEVALLLKITHIFLLVSVEFYF